MDAAGRVARGAVIAAMLLAVAPVAGCALLDDAHSRQQIDVEAFAGPRWQDWKPMSGLEVATDRLCPAAPGCLQAVSSEHLVIMKFESVSSATDHIDAEDGALHQIDPLIVDFRSSDLTRAEQEAVIGTLSNINASSPD